MLISNYFELAQITANVPVAIYGSGDTGKEIHKALCNISCNDMIFVVSNPTSCSKVLGLDVLSIKRFSISNKNGLVLIPEKSVFKDEMEATCNLLDINYAFFSKSFPCCSQEESDEQLFFEFDSYIKKLKSISVRLQPNCREECFDRKYINNYISENRSCIKGDVLEFCGGDLYAPKYANNKINLKTMAYIGHKDIYPNATYFCNLDEEATLPNAKFDCIIATQVIMYMNNPLVALSNLRKLLKPNGVLLLTVPGPLFHHSKNTHHMFSFTEESIKYLFNEVFGNYSNLKLYGNINYAEYMLFWTKAPNKANNSFDYLYTLVIGVKAILK